MFVVETEYDGYNDIVGAFENISDVIRFVVKKSYEYGLRYHEMMESGDIVYAIRVSEWNGERFIWSERAILDAAAIHAKIAAEAKAKDENASR